jgi:hypothetical protein
VELIISAGVQTKLANKNPPVSRKQIIECFGNVEGKFILDTREEHQSDPATVWFIAETNDGRKLKIAFIQRGTTVTIRTAYDPNPVELEIYARLGLGQTK